MKFPSLIVGALGLAFCFASAAPAQDGNYIPAGADMKSGVVSKLPKPGYPSALASAPDKPKGTTALRVYVNKQGALDKTKVTKSSGNDLLDKAAVTFAEKSFKFSPYIVNSKPVAWYFDYTVDFTPPAAAAAGSPTPPPSRR